MLFNKNNNGKNNITLSLGNVSLDKELGIYYIDMRPSIIHYTESIYNGGIIVPNFWTAD
jgi:hypothetical protein